MRQKNNIAGNRACRLGTYPFLIAALLIFLLPEGGEAVILTVHGVYASNQLLPWGEIAPYSPNSLDLPESVESYMKSKGMRETILPFVWGGETSDTDDAVKDLKEKIRLGFRASKVERKPFVIIAHSWGGVLVYKALHQLAKEGDKVVVDNLITMGTPVGYLKQLRVVDRGQGNTECRSTTRDARPIAITTKQELCKHAKELVGQVEKPRGLVKIENWTNYYSLDDTFSQPIQGAFNKNLQGSMRLPKVGGPIKAHAQYFEWKHEGDGWEVVRSNAENILQDLTLAIKSSEAKLHKEEGRTREGPETAEAKKCPEIKGTESASKTYQEWKQSIEKHIPVGRRLGC